MVNDQSQRKAVGGIGIGVEFIRNLSGLCSSLAGVGAGWGLAVSLICQHSST